jgi:HK97 family phage prohead protease
METKVFKLQIKEMTEEGKFTGYLSVFNNIDQGGDLVEPTAFKRTLRRNKVFPLLWAHSSQDPSHVIGTFHGKEDDYGLLINGEFFLDQTGGKEAHAVVKKLHERGGKPGLSIGYKALQWDMEDIKGQPVRRLKEVQLYEGSITLFPMNEEAQIQSIKDALEQKPFPNEHACRINDPGQYERFARMTRKHNGKEYSVIIGFKKGGGSEDQAYRYPKDTWDAADARAHCASHDGKFEAASGGKELEFRCSACGETVIVITNPEPDGKALDVPDTVDTPPVSDPPKEDEQELEALRTLVKGIKI